MSNPKKLQSDPNTFDTFDVSMILRCSIFDVYALVRDKTLPAVRDPGGSYRFVPSDIIAYQDRQEQAEEVVTK